MNLFLPVVFGLIFGFLLQRAGMGKYEVLVGQLLLTNWAVVKVMLTAILVGMVGVLTMHSRGLVKLHFKPTRLVLNIGGGLVFGTGFALLGYCPGSAAAALGEGRYDALFGMLGLVVGSYFYAECSGFIETVVAKWGDLGKRTLPEVFGVSREKFAPVFAVLLLVILLVVGRVFP